MIMIWFEVTRNIRSYKKPFPFAHHGFFCVAQGIFSLWMTFHTFHSWLSLVPPQLSQCLFHKLAHVFEGYLFECKLYHIFHTQTWFQDASFCVLKAHLLPYPSHRHHTSWFHGHLSHAVSKWFHCWRFFHKLYTLTRFSCGALWNACGNAVNCWKLSHTLDIICPFQCSWPKGFDTTEESSTQNFYFQRLVTLS